jgi:hypothetical protein
LQEVKKVQETFTGSVWDTSLLAIPFFTLLFCGFFRLDQIFASRKQDGESARRLLGGMDEDGEPIVCDPDGRPSGRPRNRQ